MEPNETCEIKRVRYNHIALFYEDACNFAKCP